jgi:excisionase family DNA binding protein
VKHEERTVSETRRYLNITEAARRLGIHPQTLRAWADKGYVEHIRMPSGYRRFDPAVIERLAVDMQVPAEGKLAA